jgi:propanol-preferring alcohol dehydrogenase
MRAMVLDRPGQPLRAAELPEPEPGPGEVKLAVRTCGVCRTDLHIYDSELQGEPKLPLVMGHQIVGTVVGLGEGSGRFELGERVGVPWLGWADGTCRYCRDGRENLCEHARFTGYDVDGGYAEFCVAGEAERIGFYGFGSSAHILCQVAVHEGRRVFAFTRDGDADGQAFARSLGAEWAGGSSELPPEELDGAIVFAAVGPLMVQALKASGRGARVISAGIHMSEIPAFSYDLLWEERTLGSVANLTRADGEDLLRVAPEIPVRAKVTTYALEDAQRALEDARAGKIEGSAVLVVTE